MQFVVRLLESVFLGAFITVVVAFVTLFTVWFFNRGIQLIASLLGYEVGDFFGWLMAKLHIKKKKLK
jgi:hypothetical protein